ncbi:MAG: hypothetical protein WCR98_02395 [Saccharofermentanales bacterium]
MSDKQRDKVVTALVVVSLFAYLWALIGDLPGLMFVGASLTLAALYLADYYWR